MIRKVFCTSLLIDTFWQWDQVLCELLVHHGFSTWMKQRKRKSCRNHWSLFGVHLNLFIEACCMIITFEHEFVRDWLILSAVTWHALLCIIYYIAETWFLGVSCYISKTDMIDVNMLPLMPSVSRVHSSTVMISFLIWQSPRWSVKKFVLPFPSEVGGNYIIAGRKLINGKKITQYSIFLRLDGLISWFGGPGARSRRWNYTEKM